MVYICKTELRQRREIRKSVAPPPPLPHLLRRSTHSYFKKIVAFLKYLLLLLFIQNISPFLIG